MGIFIGIVNLSLIMLAVKLIINSQKMSHLHHKKSFTRWNDFIKYYFKAVAYLLLSITALLFLFPIVWMVVNSFKSHAQVNADLASWATFLPSLNIASWFDNYIQLFNTFTEFGRSILNSIMYSVITIIFVLVLNSLAAYAIARWKFPGSSLIISIIIIILIVPVETSVIPLYIILKEFGLLSENLKVIGYLIPGFASPFYIFMFRSYFLGIPKELEEAAYLDGASRIRTFFSIIIPNALPVFGTVAIFTFMGTWNEYIFAQLMFSNPLQQPLQVYLQLINNFNPQDIGMVMASLTFSTIPIAIVYIFSQRYIVEGVSFTGLK